MRWRVSASSGGFNPRTPAGCDIMSTSPGIRRRKFQSTHPCGVRQTLLDIVVSEDEVSIHAPLRGATNRRRIRLRPYDVSIHAPLRGATSALAFPISLLHVSIHAPLRGATAILLIPKVSLIVSIHAPLRGATIKPMGSKYTERSFNPRTPAGCDRNSTGPSSENSSFQSTHPCGVRLGSVLARRRHGRVSIHAPLWGATPT